MPYQLSAFDAAAILIGLSAALGWLNHKVFRLPGTVALTLMGALASLAVIGIDALLPASRVSESVTTFLDDLDFHETLMNGMLSFLLFAGALHVDLDHLRKGRWQIASSAPSGSSPPRCWWGAVSGRSRGWSVSMYL